MPAARRLALRLLATCALAAHVACAAASPTASGRALLTSAAPRASARRARALSSLATLDPSDASAVRDALEAAPATRRGLVEVAVNALFDVFGFEAGGAVTYDPLCEFINPLLDDDEKLDCGQEP